MDQSLSCVKEGNEKGLNLHHHGRIYFEIIPSEVSGHEEKH